MAKNPRPRFRIGRLLLISALGLLLLAGVALAIVPRFIPWEKIKTNAEKKISETIKHKVTIGSIRFNLFRGIEIKDLKIGNARGFSREPFLTDKVAAIQYRLLPLLVGKVMVKSVKLHAPRLLIERRADGRFNFSDMLPAPSVAPSETKSKTKLPARLPLELLVARVAISDASLVYRDLEKKSEQSIEEFNLNVNNLTLAGLTPVKVTLEAKIKNQGKTIPLVLDTTWRFNYFKEKLILDEVFLELPGVKLTAAGSVNKVITGPLLDISGKVKADFNRIVNKLLPLPVREKMPREMKLDGQAEIDFKVKGQAKKIPDLQVSLKNQVNVNIYIGKMKVPLTAEGELGLKAMNLDLVQNLTSLGLQAAIKTRLEDVFQTRKLEASLTGSLDLGSMGLKILPRRQREKLAGLKTGGTINFKGQAAGLLSAPEKLSFSSRVQIAGLEASYKDKSLLKDLSAKFIILPDKITLKTLTGQLAGQTLRADFQAQGFDLRQPDTLKPGKLKAAVKWNLESELLDVDALLALFPGKKEPAGTGRPGSAKTVSDQPEPDARKFIPAKLRVEGKAKLGGLRFGTVELGAMDFSMNLKKRRLKSTGTLRGYKGSIKDSLQLDFSGKLLRYAVKARVKNVDLEPLLNDVVDTFVAAKLKKPELISELKSKMTGILSGQLDISGSGMRSAKAKPALKGQGGFTLKKGSLRQFAFQDNLAQWFGSEKLKQDIPFDHTVIEFSLGRQIVKVTKFTAESGPRGEAGDIRMTANGKLTFKADFQDFKLRPRLNPRAAKKLSPEFQKYNEILKDDRGWVTIPMVLNGPIKKPDVKPDWSWIRKQFGSKAKKKAAAAAAEAGKKMEKFITKQKDKPPEEIKQDINKELEKAKEKLKDLNLKNLFK